MFGRWLQYAYGGPPAVFELKRSMTSSLPLSQIKDHQLRALRQVATGFYHKLPDDSRSYKPFDCFYMTGIEGYLVVAYGATLTGFYVVPVSEILKLKEAGVISLKEDHAATIGEYIEIPKQHPRNT